MHLFDDSLMQQTYKKDVNFINYVYLHFLVAFSSKAVLQKQKIYLYLILLQHQGVGIIQLH